MQQARLKLASQKQGVAIQQAISKGQMPDSALSGKYGYIVDSYGNPILDKGRKIKVVSGKGGLPKIGGGLADQLGLTQNEYHSWRSRITSVSVTGRYAPTFARRSQESRKRVKRRATNVPAAATPANAAVKRLVWTQVRQALQQVVAVGAISPYLIAA